MTLKEKIRDLASANFKAVQADRRHIHSHPELSFKETATCRYVQEKLKEIGVDDIQVRGDTGVVALVEGNRPDKRVVALRADLDALPILEENEVEYRSQNKGVMHACGHDVHTSCLLGAARILAACRKDFEGTVKLIFQPGEEVNPGGASILIREGVLKKPDVQSIYGQHVFPELPAGKIGFKPGLYMASADEIYITIQGSGGHAALPHRVTDPIAIAAQVIVGMQQVVSRKAPPEVPSVLSFGKIAGGTTTNVIPDEVKLEGTFRTFDENWRKSATEWIPKIATQMAESLGGKAVVRVSSGYPFLKNDDQLTLVAQEHAREFLGKENVVDLDIRMTAEDFAYYSQQVPACFYRLGTGNDAENKSYPVHNSRFDIDESALITGSGMMAWLAVAGD